MKPQWETAPSWANWLCQDESSAWYWYEHEPVIECNSNYWYGKAGKIKLASYSEGEAPDWDQSLEHRPVNHLNGY